MLTSQTPAQNRGLFLDQKLNTQLYIQEKKKKAIQIRVIAYYKVKHCFQYTNHLPGLTLITILWRNL